MPIFISLYGYFTGKSYLFLKAWPMYNKIKIKANIGLIVSYMLLIVFTHIWPQNILQSLNTNIQVLVLQGNNKAKLK